MGSSTTQVGPPARMPSSSETSVKSPASASKRATTASSTAPSIAVVSSPPSPVRRTGSRSERLGRSASTPRTSSTAERQTVNQSVKGEEEQTRGELGVEERALLRHHLAGARHLSDLLDGRRAQQEGRLGLAGVDGGTGLFRVRRVPHLAGIPGDELRVELVGGTVDEPGAGAGVDLRDRAAAVRLLVERRKRARRQCDPVRGEDG